MIWHLTMKQMSTGCDAASILQILYPTKALHVIAIGWRERNAIAITKAHRKYAGRFLVIAKPLRQNKNQIKILKMQAITHTNLSQLHRADTNQCVSSYNQT